MAPYGARYGAQYGALNRHRARCLEREWRHAQQNIPPFSETKGRVVSMCFYDKQKPDPHHRFNRRAIRRLNRRSGRALYGGACLGG